MIKAKVNNKKQHEIIIEDLSNGIIDGKAFAWDVIEIKKDSYHVIKDNKSYTIEIVKGDNQNKTYNIKVNGNNYQVQLKDKFDELLKSLGLDELASKKIHELKAPMPGLVLDIKISEGDIIKKGDQLIVLEAMKMENSIKSPTDGIIKKVNVKKGMAVEKNQVLINFV